MKKKYQILLFNNFNSWSNRLFDLSAKSELSIAAMRPPIQNWPDVKAFETFGSFDSVVEVEGREVKQALIRVNAVSILLDGSVYSFGT